MPNAAKNPQTPRSDCCRSAAMCAADDPRSRTSATNLPPLPGARTTTSASARASNAPGFSPPFVARGIGVESTYTNTSCVRRRGLRVRAPPTVDSVTRASGRRRLLREGMCRCGPTPYRLRTCPLPTVECPYDPVGLALRPGAAVGGRASSRVPARSGGDAAALPGIAGEEWPETGIARLRPLRRRRQRSRPNARSSCP